MEHMDIKTMNFLLLSFIVFIIFICGCATVPISANYQITNDACATNGTIWTNETCANQCGNNTNCLTDCSYFTYYGQRFSNDINSDDQVDLNGG